MRKKRFYAILRVLALGVAISQRFLMKSVREIKKPIYDKEILGI
ncbi:MAG: hypothetical protein ABJG78_03305 [Cyclobacteriaceae bacterium]